MTAGFASVAAAVLDHNGHPVAGVAVTYPADRPVDASDAVRRVAAAISARLAGRRLTKP